jgi:hypothetical protein
MFVIGSWFTTMTMTTTPGGTMPGGSGRVLQERDAAK